MTQTWALLLLFIVAMAALPWGLKRWQQRSGGATGVAQSRVLSAVAVGPQQRVVTLEVGHGAQRAVLVLGVTAQQISCLHTFDAAAPVASDFARELAAVPAAMPAAGVEHA